MKRIGEKEKDPYRRRKALEKVRDRLPPVTDFDAIFIPDFPKNLKLLAPALAVEDVVTQTCLPEELKRIAKSTGRARPEAGAAPRARNGWGGDPTLYDTSPGGAGRHVRCAIFVDGFFAGSARPATKAFVDAFQKKYAGQMPTILEASAYDAARMIREAHGAAQGADPRGPPRRPGGGARASPAPPVTSPWVRAGPRRRTSSS